MNINRKGNLLEEKPPQKWHHRHAVRNVSPNNKEYIQDNHIDQDIKMAISADCVEYLSLPFQYVKLSADSPFLETELCLHNFYKQILSVTHTHKKPTIT